jgi:hypothetical protein
MADIIDGPLLSDLTVCVLVYFSEKPVRCYDSSSSVTKYIAVGWKFYTNFKLTTPLESIHIAGIRKDW